MTYINPEFRNRNVPQITGTVKLPIEAQARDVTPRSDNRAHYVFCAILAVPVILATYAAFVGDMRLCAIACLVGMAIALIGLYSLRGPA